MEKSSAETEQGEVEGERLTLDLTFCQCCSNERKATFRCQECNEYLCLECCEAHRRVTITKRHPLVAMAQVSESPTPELRSNEEICERHDEKKKLFCKTCRLTICSICAFTLHKGHHEVSELDTMVKNNKLELLSLCGEMADIQKNLSARLDAVKAAVDLLNSRQKTTTVEVEALFSTLVTTVLNRKAAVLSALADSVSAVKLRLEKQMANLRASLAACETVADDGKRVASLGSPAQVQAQKGEINRHIREWKKQGSVLVRTPPTYEVNTQALESITCALGKLGSVSESTADEDGSSNGESSIKITYPEFKLDAVKCNDRCTVEDGGCSLRNSPSSICEHYESLDTCKFSGTCGTMALASGASYWQVRCVATPAPEIKMWYLWDVGMATAQAMDAYSAQAISQSNHCALSAWLYREGNSIVLQANYKNRNLADVGIDTLVPDEIVEYTLGFLLDVPRQRLYVLDVEEADLLCESKIDVSQPLWPVFRLPSVEYSGADVVLEIQTGDRIEMSSPLMELLMNLML